ncbi:aminotransferase class I/II-fold pyridoxal phosphate-dependent enzyme [Bacterioplanes sanyensis]|nr:aminotransferase class I/II-fold pyridoxal phosphate-dependent enzyme [Bacterioplanes sanyensis]
MDNTTRAIHSPAVYLDDSHAESIAMTSAYDFHSAADAHARFSGEKPGNVYSRFTNPSVEMFENKLAALEGGDAAIGLASGMSAYLAIAMTFLRQGDHVLLASGIFGTTTHLFRQYFGQFGITATSVQVDDYDAWQAEMRPNTKLMVVESPTNPLMGVADLVKLSTLAKRHDAILVVDNTLLTPVLQQPLQWGADLVLHSAGKFLDGQGRCVGGAIVGRHDLLKPLRAYLRASGICMSPFNAWILSKGIETLKARMNLHEHNARQVFSWLRQQSDIEQVYSTMAADHPNRDVIQRQQTGHSPIITFKLRGDRDHAWRFIDALKLVSRCTNIGDAKTMVTHPATTTHGRYTAEEKQRHGITENLVRLCVGFESPADIIDDLNQALVAAQQPVETAVLVC